MQRHCQTEPHTISAGLGSLRRIYESNLNCETNYIMSVLLFVCTIGHQYPTYMNKAIKHTSMILLKHTNLQLKYVYHNSY